MVFPLDDLNDWYNVTLVNDGTKTEIYVNGVTDFRNADPKRCNIASGMLPTIDGYGWLVGASGYYAKDNNGDGIGIGKFPITKLFDGNIQELRFSKGALPKDKWLYSELSTKGHTKQGTNDDIELLTDKDNYNIVFVPDTQKTSRYMPEIVDRQMEWLAKHKDDKNIVFINFLGDLVDRFQQKYEWDNILMSVKYLKDGKVRFMTIDGNHDGHGAPAGKKYLLILIALDLSTTKDQTIIPTSLLRDILLTPSLEERLYVPIHLCTILSAYFFAKCTVDQ